MYKVSVIIPVYNSQNYLKKCLESVLNQSLDDFEVIVIDDGSQDRSLDIIKSFAEKHTNLKYKSKINEGQAIARNLGISMAEGEYILFVDSDDYIDKKMLEKLYNNAIKCDSDIVVCDYYEEYNDKINLKKSLYIKADNIVKSYIVSVAGPCSKLIRKEIFTKNKIYFLENTIYEDLAIIPSLALYTNKISYLEEALYYYVIRQESTMQKTKYDKSMESIFKVMDLIYNEFKGKGYDQELEFLYINHLLYAACGRFLKYKNTEDKIVEAIKIMKNKFPKWRKNKYLNQQSIKYRLTCCIFSRYNKFEIAIYKLLRKIINKGDLV